MAIRKTLKDKSQTFSLAFHTIKMNQDLKPLVKVIGKLKYEKKKKKKSSCISNKISD